MASGFPGSIDSFTNPLTTSALNSPSHAGQHQDLNDAVNKIENYMGLVKVIPTGVTGGTLAANGTITIGNAVSTVAVTGAFSSLYDNYKILIQGGSATANTDYVRLQLGSTTSGYRYDYIFANMASGTPASAGTVAGANFAYCGIASLTLFANIEVMGPFATGMTTVQALAGRTGQNMGMMVGTQIDSTSFTGFTILSGVGITFTGGTIRVYGYRN